MRALIALFLGLAPLAGTAEPVELYQSGAPSSAELYEPETGRFSGPNANWQAYVDALGGDWRAQAQFPFAIIDSGVITKHPLIEPVLLEAIDLTGTGPEDEIGHGTFVTLLFLSGSGPSPVISIKIVSPQDEASVDGEARLIEALQIADAKGARVANVSAGVDLVCANSRDPNPPSWLIPCEETRLCKLLGELENMSVVAAVGNDPSTTGCPACCANSIAVGAADNDGQAADYSGLFADILAPGTVERVPIGQARP